MIIRSGLIRNRDDVDFAAFSEHWRRVHGPLALRVEAMRAYRQNNILARLPAREGDRLHRVDGISQLWFDNVESMRVAMESAEQRVCIEDIRGFLSDVTIVIQQEGKRRQHGDVDPLPVKFIYLLAGPEAAMKPMEDRLFADLAASFANAALRVNPIVDRGFSVDPTVSAGDQIIDAVLEHWLTQETHDAVVAAHPVLQNFAGGAHSDVALARGDKRFKDKVWQEMPYYDLLKQSYLLGSRQLHEFVDRAQVDDKTKLQLRFYARQFMDAMSPSNFPATNPEVIRKAIETRSVSLTDGMQNLIDDLKKGRITRVDESAFEVGRNLAVTPGSVVFENELIQLIQYAPQTGEVEKTPLLIVPPCINKFYLLDLGEGNSLVEYAVAQGHQVFLISWRSAVPEIGHLTWDDYLEKGPLKAVDVILDITGAERTNALGFCVGGTILVRRP